MSGQPTVPEMKREVVMLPPELQERLKDYAERHDRSKSAVLRRALRDHLDRESNGEAA